MQRYQLAGVAVGRDLKIAASAGYSAVAERGVVFPSHAKIRASVKILLETHSGASLLEGLAWFAEAVATLDLAASLADLETAGRLACVFFVIVGGRIRRVWRLLTDFSKGKLRLCLWGL